MRILMLPKCTSSHASWEVRTLISHTDKKYTVPLFSRKLCGAQGRKLPPTTQKPHPGAFSAAGMRLELCGAQGQLRPRLHRLVLAHDFLRQFAIGI